MHPKQRDDLDFTMKAKCEELSARFHNLKADSLDQLAADMGCVLEQLNDGIIDHKMARVMVDGLFKIASLRKDFLTVDFPNQVLRQFNEKNELREAAIIKAHNELLCPECFKKVSQKLGWVKKSTA